MEESALNEQSQEKKTKMESTPTTPIIPLKQQAKPKMERSARAYSVKQVINKKRKVLDFDGTFLESFGRPEQNAIWFIWGGSGNGKTRFTLQLCKYLTKFDKVDYNSLEEGNCESMSLAFQELQMEEVDGKFRLLDVMHFEEFVIRLSGKKLLALVSLILFNMPGLIIPVIRRLKSG